jgi:hypothetical protein
MSNIHVSNFRVLGYACAASLLTSDAAHAISPAQGAFRMRGIGRGQHITVLVIPEVQELMNRQLGKLPSSAGDASIPAITADAAPLLLSPAADSGGAVRRADMVAAQARRLRDISGSL